MVVELSEGDCSTADRCLDGVAKGGRGMERKVGKAYFYDSLICPAPIAYL